MTTEKMTDFLSLVDADHKLQAEVAQAFETAGPGGIVEVAADHGFSFRQEDLQKVFDQVSEELSDDDLEAVSGGLVPQVTTERSWGTLSRALRRLTVPTGLGGVEPSGTGRTSPYAFDDEIDA